MTTTANIEVIETRTDLVNIETKLYKGPVDPFGNSYYVRLRDLDAEENIGITVFKTLELAKKYYDSVIRDSVR